MLPRTLVPRAALLGALALGGLAPFVETPAAAPLRRAAVVLDRDDPATREAAFAAIGLAGGRVVHAFDGLLVVEVPPSEAARIGRTAAVREMTETAISSRKARGRSETFRLGLEAWNRVLRDGAATPAGRGRPLPGEPFDGEHAFVPPSPPDGAVAAAVALASAGLAGDGPFLDRTSPPAAFAPASLPYGAGAENTSEFLAGRVAVNVVLMESDGSIDVPTENWSADRESLVASNVVAALDWLRAQEPQARLSFVYHLFPGRTDVRARTGYEPIRRSADPNGNSGEALWLPQILAKFGYASGDRWIRSRAWAHATRLADGSDWAVNLFVADSLQDTDGRFADGHFAYTWVGGPHVVMTYDNYTWGVSRMFMVLRHEFLHAFYAFDEYTTSGCACSASRGYLNGPGSNCNACNPAAAPCVMIANGDDTCAPTRRQIGWADLDGDGVVDVVGQDPDTFVDTVPEVACGPVVVTGTASVVAATNLNPLTVTPRRSISVAKVAGVDLREGSQAWTSTVAADGAWDGPVEEFRAELAPGNGSRRFEFRSRDDYGNPDGTPVALSLTIHPAVEKIPGPLLLLRLGGGIRLSWPATAGAAFFRIQVAPAAAGPWRVAGETDELGWSDAPDGPAYYRMSAVDGCGREGP